MDDDRTHRPADTADEDADLRIQGALLVHLLTEHPIQFTEDDLIRQLAENPSDFGEADDVKRAIRQLVAVGLLYRNGVIYLPSPAAFRAYKLMGGGVV
jgi:hypothetical protein